MFNIKNKELSNVAGYVSVLEIDGNEHSQWMIELSNPGVNGVDMEIEARIQLFEDGVIYAGNNSRPSELFDNQGMLSLSSVMKLNGNTAQTVINTGTYPNRSSVDLYGGEALLFLVRPNCNFHKFSLMVHYQGVEPTALLDCKARPLPYTKFASGG